MEKQKIELEVSSASYAVGHALEGVVDSIKTALADGWQPGQDLPAIVIGSVSALAPAVGQITSLPESAKEDPEAFTDGLYIPIKRAVFKLVKKAPVA
jgi:hypothetical protein